ncbi:MAG: alpha-amylase [Lachnospiraceae bacterium]|jgi:glycogen operon protein|nr:alpha-amylase [Lachnospiraceae bacterium]
MDKRRGIMDKQGEGSIKIEKGMPVPLGTTMGNGGINFAVSLPDVDACDLKLYQIHAGELVATIHLNEQYKTGSVFSVFIKTAQSDNVKPIRKTPEFSLKDYVYTYQIGKNEFLDPYAKVVYGRNVYGKILSEDEKLQLRGGVLLQDFDWQQDTKLRLPYSRLIIYKLNVRGFTKHDSSKVKQKGTFLGISEKIPYLKELGINCIQCMPIYEFNEIISGSQRYESKNAGLDCKINYWGYSSDNLYFAPKASYGTNPYNVANELKTLVKNLHQNGIEMIMEMYFPYGTNQNLIHDCLRFWSMEYHIDGFKLTGGALPYQLIASDPILSNTKLFANGWDTEAIYGRDFIPNTKNLAEYNDVYSVNLKRLLKGDESQVRTFAEGMKYNPIKCGVINYVTNQDGFTLMDLYSYDLKHNEINGEKNADGMEYNYSWNCGQEGKTKKKKIIELRKKQIRNAFMLLFCSQGTPLLLAGDEFGNSQQGNNNAYCQDNEISWLNWEDLNTNREIYEYVKSMIQLRKQHPILHMEQPLRSMDYISCGFPDISYHGTKAWYPDYSYYSRLLGIMLTGRYAKINRNDNDNTFYLAINMHWDNHTYDLPKLPKGMRWHIVADTNEASIREEKNIFALDNQLQYEVVARSCILFIGK